MNPSELEDIVLRNTAQLSEVRRQLDDLVSKEKRARTALEELRHGIVDCLERFHRDKYKSTEQRLLIRVLASELSIFDKLGYDIAVPGWRFLLGVDAFLGGRSQSALDYLTHSIRNTQSSGKNFRDAHYLAAMICYNRRDFGKGMEHYETVFNHSPENARDWQAKTYVGELMYFQRRPKGQFESVFREVEDGLRSEDYPLQNPLQANLYLKWGNCFVGTVDLQPKEHNPFVNAQLAISFFKKAKKSLPRYADPDSLLSIVVDYSLAQALLVAGSIDMDLAITPGELLADVFRRLRRIVLAKREEIILTQCYLMLGTCAFYSPYVSRDMGEIYLESARNQTLAVPLDVCFYSCVTKELLTRNELAGQIDYFARLLEGEGERR